MLLVKVGARYIHLLKMFGALFTFACAFFVLSAAYDLNQVLEAASLSSSSNSMGNIFGALTGPIGSLFLWLSLMVLGLALYRSDRTILPLEEDIEDYSDTRSYPQTPVTRVSNRK
jgi:hypothetical protein